VLDTKAARVLARSAGHALGRREAQAAADAWVPAGRGWAWNQAVLDLGATVCTARRPSCGACPIAPWCAWDTVDIYPDPAIGSGVSTGQSRFEGSDRQGRGRLVDALRRDGVVRPADLAGAAGWTDDEPRAARVAETLVADGLAVWRGSDLVLP
jgi:A/G-specific adenine glycosylase